MRSVELVLNSLGDDACRPAYLRVLRAFLEARRSELCEEHQERVAENPLRVLDCKRPQCRTVTDSAPRMIDHLCEECDAHFARVQAGLEALAIPYRIDHRLV